MKNIQNTVKYFAKELRVQEMSCNEIELTYQLYEYGFGKITDSEL